MKFFFPDSQDLVDPSFDFEKETRSDQRLRHRDDLYAHEVFSEPAYDGLLVSKASVDGKAGRRAAAIPWPSATAYCGSACGTSFA